MIVKKWLAPVGGALLITSLQAQAFEISPEAKLHLDYATHSDDRKELSDGSLVRRARFGVEGEHEDWSFKVDYEFTDEGSFKNAYISYEGLEAADIFVGQQKIPFGLEQQTSSDNIVFLERALPVEAFEPSRGIGVGFHQEGDRHTLSMMGFGPEITEGDERYGLGARATFAPILEKDRRLLHFGVSATTEEVKEDSVKLSVRPESRPADEKLVNTGGIDDVDRINRLGLETAWQRGPLSAQAEWMRADLHREAGDPNVNFDGWYLSGSWVLTGEVRPYRHGVFKGIEPEGDNGAWELTARYSRVDLDDRDIEGGDEKNLSVGMNWYIDDDLRVMLDYIHVDSDRRGKSDDPDILAMRVQLNF